MKGRRVAVERWGVAVERWVVAVERWEEWQLKDWGNDS